MTDQNDNSDRFDVLRQLNEISRQNLSYLTGALPPFTAALAKWNLEMLRFSAQRALEYRELSARLSQCRTPVELWGEQTRFFEHMQEEYAEEMGRLLDLLNGISQVKPEEGEAGVSSKAGETAEAPSPGVAPGSAPEETGTPAASTAMKQSADAMSETARAARDMAGAATSAAEHVADEARTAMQQVDNSAPGAPQAQAAITAAETAAKTIARQAEATAALVAGSAAAMGTATAAEALEETGAESSESEDAEGESEDADVAATLIAEPSPAETSDDSDDEVSASDVEDESQSAEAMLSEPAPEQEDDSGEEGDVDVDGASIMDALPNDPHMEASEPDDTQAEDVIADMQPEPSSEDTGPVTPAASEAVTDEQDEPEDDQADEPAPGPEPQEGGDNDPTDNRTQ